MCSLDSVADSISSGSVLDSDAFLGYSDLSLICSDRDSVVSETKTALSFCDWEDSDDISVYYVEDEEDNVELETNGCFSVDSVRAEEFPREMVGAMAALDELDSELLSTESEFEVCSVVSDYESAAIELKLKNIRLAGKLMELNSLRQSMNTNYEDIDRELTAAEQSLKDLCDLVDDIGGVRKSHRSNNEILYDRELLGKTLQEFGSSRFPAVEKTVHGLQSFSKNVGTLRAFMGDVFAETMSRELVEKVDSLSLNASALQEDFTTHDKCWNDGF